MVGSQAALKGQEEGPSEGGIRISQIRGHKVCSWLGEQHGLGPGDDGEQGNIPGTGCGGASSCGVRGDRQWSLDSIQG